MAMQWLDCVNASKSSPPAMPENHKRELVSSIDKDRRIEQQAIASIRLNMPDDSDNQPLRHRVRRTAEREWTAVEKFRLKGLAKQSYSADRIARALRRPVDATVAMASRLGLHLT